VDEDGDESAEAIERGGKNGLRGREGEQKGEREGGESQCRKGCRSAKVAAGPVSTGAFTLHFMANPKQELTL
jgi:hypothetical protein